MATPPGRVAVAELEAAAEEEDEESKETAAQGKVQYYDENSNKYEVDVLAMEARLLEKGEPDQEGFAEEFRPALNGALEKYMQMKFYEGAGKASAFVFNNPSCAQIFLSAHNESFKNFRVGGWVSQWQADVDETTGHFSLKVGPASRRGRCG